MHNISPILTFAFKVYLREPMLKNGILLGQCGNPVNPSQILMTHGIHISQSSDSHRKQRSCSFFPCIVMVAVKVFS